MSDDIAYVSVANAVAALSRMRQWIGEGEIPERARSEAEEWLRRQPAFEHPEHAPERQRPRSAWEVAADLIDPPKDPAT